MSVELEPAELGFRRPFNHEVSQVLRLRNPNSDPVAFKVKTTAPKQYCVRPNSGRIDAGRDVEVQVLLQAMKEDPPLDTRCRDKFLVQSVAVRSDDESTSVSQVWSNLESSAKGRIQEKKIRVTYLPAAPSSAAVVNGVDGAVHEDDQPPPAYTSPEVAITTPQKTTATTSRGDASDTAPSPTPDTTTFAAAASTVTSPLGVSKEDLQRQLDAAKARISELQQQVSQGLRQRTTAKEGDEKTAATTATTTTNQEIQNAPAPGGVPVQIVALLCLVCFLLAYFLF